MEKLLQRKTGPHNFIDHTINKKNNETLYNVNPTLFLKCIKKHITDIKALLKLNLTIQSNQ